MPPIKRRQFLQFTGSALATLGLSQLETQRQGFRYAKVLAQSTPRKLALLVGINAYLDSPLDGCITDVELQRELLVHRFGFNPKDILLVTDETEIKPTRQGILQAFEEHLIKQAKPGDVVVYHFSGHGSQVFDPESGFEDQLNSTFVPIDRSESSAGDKATVSDITGATLFLLMSAIKTENFTAVLDSCHSGGGKRGNFRVRAIRGGSEFSASPGEIDYQQQWLSRLNLSPKEFVKRRAGVAKGIVIASAKRDQLALDADFDSPSAGSFSAGAFTYYMTKYLWQQTGSTRVVSAINQIAIRTTRDLAQDPELECTPRCQPDNNDTDKRPFYFLASQAPPAEAVITGVTGSQFTCWLGGIDSSNPLGKDSIFSIVEGNGKELAKVRLNSRQGLTGKGTLIEGNSGALREGALLQEQVRGLPSNLTLRIGLDPTLQPDTAQAEQALKSLPRIEALPLGKEQVDYILGRLSEAERQKLQKLASKPLVTDSFGLFTPTKERIVEGSFGTATETVEAAVMRLQSKLKLLLAGRALQSIVNTDASKLAVTAKIDPVGGRGGETFAAATTRRGRGGSRGGDAIVPTAIAANVGQVKPGTKIQILVENQEPRDLYISVLAIGSDGEMTVLFPSDFTAATDASLVGAGQKLEVPKLGRDKFDFNVKGPAGTVEILILASVASLREALKGLQRISSRTGQQRGEPLAVDDPSEVMTGLLGDLTGSTRAAVETTRTNGTNMVGTTTLAALSIAFEVV